MSTIPTLPGIRSLDIKTERLKVHILAAHAHGGEPILFIHGNASSATFWEEVMTKLPSNYHGVAPDLRGYGDTEDKLVDATRGFEDWVDDLITFTNTVKLGKYHVVGHSLGGSIAMALIATDAANIKSATLICPGSPYGFGGTKDVNGTPCHADFAGSGGGVVNPTFAQLMAQGDRSSDNPQASPRVVMNSFYFKPPFKPAREEELLSSVLSEKIGPEKYPGDSTSSPNWPHVAPGKWGPANALSPKYHQDSVAKLLAANPKPPVLWVRGSHDQIVSDMSLFCLGTLGQLGAIPGWPGSEVYPPQPMVGQTRAVLEKYGNYKEIVMQDTGHSPFIERPDEFMKHFLAHIKSAQ